MIATFWAVTVYLTVVVSRATKATCPAQLSTRHYSRYGVQEFLTNGGLIRFYNQFLNFRNTLYLFNVARPTNMTTASGYLDRKPGGTGRPGLSYLQAPPSPQTPRRTLSSAFSSPSNYRGEEDVLVFELGARHLSAGFAGEFYPRCNLGFGPTDSQRVGDYRRWAPGFDQRSKRKREGYEWGEDHELWRMDLRELDLGLVGDKIERAAREACSKYLLLEPKSKKLFLLLPSVIPHQLLSNIIFTLFHNFAYGSISLLCTSIACVLGAGCRSGLVIDIGWSETVITSVCEYRETSQWRTTRAMKLLTKEMGKMLYRREFCTSLASSNELDLDTDDKASASLNGSFEHCEEITTRMAWCPAVGELSQISAINEDVTHAVGNLSINQDEYSNTGNHSIEDPLTSIASPFPPHQNIWIPFSSLANPVEAAFFAPASTVHDIDIQEQPLHRLIYKALLVLPPDIRSVCMSRIIVVGGGSNIPGLKSRLLEEVSNLVKDRGWDPIYGKAADERRRRIKGVSAHRRTCSLPDGSAAHAPQDQDSIGEKLRKEQGKFMKSTVSGVIRGVETLGAWAGGSLTADLKIQSIVEIDKDYFTQHGLAGARRDIESSVVSQQQSDYAAGISRTGLSQKTGWTLGGWA